MGTQYRSVVFYHDQEQEAVAEEMISELDASGKWRDPIVTEVVPFEAFYKVEDYHQETYQRNQNQPYCRVVIAPKLIKFRKVYLTQLR